MASISPTQSNVQAALDAFLSAVLPGVAGSQPATFQGSISGAALTVSALPGLVPAGIQGAIQSFAPLLGLGVAPGTFIIAQLSGPAGGPGTYQVSSAQTVSKTTMSTGVSIVAGQQNRAVETPNPYFAVMTPTRIMRLATDVDAQGDVKFAGSISGSTMTVSSVTTGQIALGAAVFGVGVAANTTVVGFLTGTGGAGTYRVAPAQTVTSTTLSAGQKTITQSAEIVVQIDFHAPDTQAADFAQVVSTALRDEYGTTFFSSLTGALAGVTPLYADDPRQVPFINAENQYEWRWSLDAHFEIDQVVAVPQQYADSISLLVQSVDAIQVAVSGDAQPLGMP